MNFNAIISVQSIPDLLRGSAAHLRRWIENWRAHQFVAAIVVIVIGCAAYGAAVGFWRAPLQGFYVAVKFPVIVLGTAFGNALLNGMLASQIGLRIGFRQSLLAILLSFMIAALILGAVAPLILFLVWNAPAIEQANSAGAVHATILLVNTAAVAWAGIAANWRLIQLLRELSGSRTIALRTLFAWLLGNLFLGSQLSWIFRPFIGSPGLPVQFLRPDAFAGNFYEAVFHAVQHFLR